MTTPLRLKKLPLPFYNHNSILESLEQHSAFILENVLPRELVQKAHLDARLALEEEEGYVRWQLFKKETRTGYTPAGIEGTAHKGPNYARHFFGAGTILSQYLRTVKGLHHRVMAKAPYRVSLFQFIEPRPEVILPNGERAEDFFRRQLGRVRHAL